MLSKIGKELYYEKSKSASLSHEVQEKTLEIKSLSKEKKQLQTKTQEIFKDLKRTRQREEYYRQKVVKLESQEKRYEHGDGEELETDDLNRKIYDLKMENQQIKAAYRVRI